MVIFCSGSRSHQPILILLHREEHNRFWHIRFLRTTASSTPSFQSPHRSLLILRGRNGFHDRGDELLEEIQFEEGRPEELDEVDHESFDMRTIVILIGHDDKMTIAKIFCAGVHCIISMG